MRWAKDAPDGDGPMIDDKAFLAGIGHLLIEMEASACTPAAMGQGEGLRHGPAGLRGAHRPDRPGRDPAVRRGRRHRRRRRSNSATGQAQHTATPGGTVEVFRTIIAQHDLGLPRPDYPGRKVFLQGRAATTAA